MEQVLWRPFRQLTNVARASLEELLTDYRDFLRSRSLAEWEPEHPYTRRLRQAQPPARRVL